MEQKNDAVYQIYDQETVEGEKPDQEQKAEGPTAA